MLLFSTQVGTATVSPQELITSPPTYNSIETVLVVFDQQNT
jgi:hypothetical protein